MSKSKRITVAEYLTQQINICGRSQKDIADDVGYDKPNVITMFKQGKTKLPTNKVPVFAKALGVDPIHLLRIVMSEYTPDTWDVIENLLGDSIITEEERTILDIVRTVSGGQSCSPQTEADARELAELAAKWKESSEKSARAAQERVDRDGGRPGGATTKA